jgi:hypothetical protein
MAVANVLSWAGPDGSLWNRCKVTLALWEGTVPLNSGHKGRAVWGGGALFTGVHGTVPFDRESCLSGSGQAVHGALPGYSLPAAALFRTMRAFSRPSSITRHLAGYFVLLVCSIMQIIVTKYSITDLGLQSSTLIAEAEQWWWLIGAGWSSNDINIWRHHDKQVGCIYLACVGAGAIYVYRV